VRDKISERQNIRSFAEEMASNIKLHRTREDQNFDLSVTYLHLLLALCLNSRKSSLVRLGRHKGKPEFVGDHRTNFNKAWRDFNRGLLPEMEVPYPKIDNAAGKKATMYQDDNLRYDREKAIKSNSGHPHGNFMNYSIQANDKTDNERLSKLANGGNGPGKVKPRGNVPPGPTFGGSTVASVNLQ
jgi:hypothetical protein